MICKNCGNQILNDHKFCSNCGKKIKKSPNYIILISMPLIVLSFVFFIYNAFIYNNNIVEKSSKIINKEEKSNNDILVREINNETEVLFDNHKIIIPNGYSYKIISDSLSIYPINGDWYFIIGISKGNFISLKKNQDITRKHFIDSGYKVNNYGIITKQNSEWLTYELVNGSIKCLAGYTKFNSVETIGFVIKTDNNTYNYDLLDDISEIIRNIR